MLTSVKINSVPLETMKKSEPYDQFLISLKRSIRARKMSQKDAAERLGKSGPWLSAILRGRRGMNLFDFVQMVEVLGLPVEELFPGLGEKKNLSDDEIADRLLEVLPKDVIMKLVLRAK